jgi:hypothetical protein
MAFISSTINLLATRHGALIVKCSTEGVPHLREDETPPQGGIPGWAAIPNPRIGPWLRLLKKVATGQGLVPEFEVPFSSFVMYIVSSTKDFNHGCFCF